MRISGSRLKMVRDVCIIQCIYRLIDKGGNNGDGKERSEISGGRGGEECRRRMKTS